MSRITVSCYVQQLNHALRASGRATLPRAIDDVIGEYPWGQILFTVYSQGMG